MRTPDERLKILRWSNPFTSSSVGDPWESTYPDVSFVNEQAFKGLCQLIDQKTQDPALNCAGLILGEVGSGKTHLISRILKCSRQAESPFSFAYIQPIEDPEQTFRYLLREVMVNLCHPIDATPYTTQLESYNPEALIKVIYSLDDGRKLQITGQYDALLFDSAAGEAVFVEFKGHKVGHADEDFLQIALYCWLIKTATGVTPRGVVLYLEEDEPEVLYSAKDIHHAMQNFSNLSSRSWMS